MHAFREGEWHIYDARNELRVIPKHRPRLLETLDGAVWVAGLGEDAARLDRGTDRWVTYEGLSFGCETPDGVQWFLSQDGGVVTCNGRNWVRYGVEDGLIDTPAYIQATRKGMVWAAGSHDSTAATARFDGRTWSREIHPGLFWGIKGSYEALDGDLWFLGSQDWIPARGHLGGVLWFDGKTWTHYTPPEAPHAPYCMGQTVDGTLWFGGNRMFRFDGQVWSSVEESLELRNWILHMFSASKGDLWAGTRTYGVVHYDGAAWNRFDVKDGLASNLIYGIVGDNRGSVWAATDEGISRFDGQVWTTHALPSTGSLQGRGLLRWAPSGALWINPVPVIGFARRARPGVPQLSASKYRLQTVRYTPDTQPPNTEITVSMNRVSQPGNTTLGWRGADPWRSTPGGERQYAHRLDGGEWSAFSHEKSTILEALPSGDHTFEVKARDRDFNEDPTPASVRFTVVPPVWQEPWFIGLMAVLLSGIGFQTTRVIRRDRRLQAVNRDLDESNAALSSANKELFGLAYSRFLELQEKEEHNRQLEDANRAMSDANKELFAANQALQRDRAVERIRGEVQAMEQASDFERILSLLSEDLTTVGLSFDTCGIDVLDEPMDQPSMAYFENHGFRYTTYTINPEGRVTDQFYHVPAPFPEVIQETIERFIAGEPWQALIGGTQAILEVPAAGYGRLRITSSDRQDFTEGDIAALQDFATAIGLGYARYLDIREIQEQTERKSKFLASMSHELRTPMNAIIGFTNMVLRRAGDVLPERQKGNLEKVLEAGNRLLGLINDLLDLSKVEAGRMDVDVKRFRVDTLVWSYCAEVEPLVKPGVKLVCEAADGVGEAETDEGRVRQIVTNLLSNAIKFTSQGEVRVAVEHCQLKIANSQLKIENASSAGFEISVSDTGAGIPADALETIFEEFQ